VISAIPLGSVLKKSDNWIEIDPLKHYTELTVHLWGRGASARRTVEGSEIAGPRRLEVLKGEFVVSRIDARHGAFAIIPDDLNGAIVSNDFPTFRPNPERLLPEYLGWLSRTQAFVQACRAASEGTTNRIRLKEETFAQIEIRLPPLAEQRRIVAEMERVTAKIEEARELQKIIETEAVALCHAIISPEHCDKIETIRVGELVTLREPDVDVQADEEYHFAGIYSFGRGVFRGETRSGLNCSYKRLTRLRLNDFVYPKLMAWEGAFGLVTEDCAGLVVSTEFPVFGIDTSRALPEFFDVYFSDPKVWPTLPSKGTNVRRRRLHPEDFGLYEVPLPDRKTQLKLSTTKAKVDRLKALQAQTRAELDALLPSILDRAFKGAL
jgi:type I restriction enzyme S subunit